MIGGLLKSASSTALFAALGLIALSTGVPAAKAADLGGDCCADLEERVAELEATTARKGNRRVSLTISGQVATSVMSWNAHGLADQPAVAAAGGNPAIPAAANAMGSSSDTYVTDSTQAGGTFFDLSGSARVNPNVTAGFQLTVAICGQSRNHHTNQADDTAVALSDQRRTHHTYQAEDDASTPSGHCFDGAGVSTMVLTRANWYVDHKSLGRVTVGRQDTATAGITTIDLGGAGVAASANIGY